mgnify:CR=1 FL=1
MKMMMPSHARRVTHYRDDAIPLFHRYQVEAAAKLETRDFALQKGSPWHPDSVKTADRQLHLALEAGVPIVPVVFRNALDGGADYVKRVVGLPGDEVQMRDGVLHINGEPALLRGLDVYDGVDPYGEPVRVRLYEETLPGGCSYRVQHYDYADGRVEGQDDTFIFHVPEDSYFVMGDNRDAS